jgi:hypothetical protein
MNSTAMSTMDGRRTEPPWVFRGARLTTAGWAAILAPGYLAGIAIAVATAHGKPGIGRVLRWAIGGALSTALIARGIDEISWRGRPVSLEVDEPDAALDLMQAVRAEGVRADMVRSDHVTSAPA